MTKKQKQKTKSESDSAYILKLIFFIILGGLWLRIGLNVSGWAIPLPLGFAVGLLFALHERFQIDRKIEYALLVGSMFISFFLPFGLVLSV